MTKLKLNNISEGNARRSINSLPAEILAQIFRLVAIDTQPCFLERGKYSGYPNYPETLLRICSHWRQIALSSPRLWSRIDVVLSDPAGQQLLERAEIFLERAGQSPLDLRIFDKPIRSWRPFLARSKDEFLNEEGYDEDFEEGSSDDSGGEEYEQDALYGSDDLSDPDGLGNSGVFSASIRPDASGFLPSLPELAPMRSIEFVIASKRSYSSVFAPILTRCFENCLPGTLTKLVLRVEADGSAGFILPSSKQAETVWLPITSLHMLGGIRPPWGSSAFKGLTDLRFGESGSDSIPELQLVNILRSSPKLRILQFHLKIGAASPLSTTVEPIHLDDLEVLDLIEKHSDQKAVAFETFTRWIALGQKPLSLFLWCPLHSDRVKNFFRRANVVELHVRLHGNTTDSLERLIDLSPKLRMLAVDGCGGDFNPRSAFKSSDPSHSFTKIDTLHLQYCGSQFDLLKKMVQTRSIQTLTMWSSHIRRGTYGVSHKEILALCPNSKILKRREFISMNDWIKSIA